MCIACIEYLKNQWTTDEFKAALRETTLDDAAHQKEVEALMQEFAGKPDELKQKLQQLLQRQKR